MHLSPGRYYDLARKTYESYTNPRLENEGANYLSAEHIEQLRDDSEITVWDEYAKENVIEGAGTLRRIGIRTKQGYTYDTLIGIPETPTCEVPVIATTAWTTSLRGHNERTVRNLMKNGCYVLFVGAEGSYVADDSVEPTSTVSLAGSASAVLNFSYHMVNELRKEGHSVDERMRLVLGESRGGMVAEGIDALAEEFCQEVLFTDQIAPCLPEQLGGLSDIYRLAEQVAKEPREMYRLIGRLTLARLQYYPHTLDIRAHSLYHQIIIGGALFSGETGHMSLHTPGTALKHITVFDNDFASNWNWWNARYGDNPLVRITPLPGSHMTIADPETLLYVLARNKAAQYFINTGKPMSDQVFDLSHAFIDRQEHGKPSLKLVA